MWKENEKNSLLSAYSRNVLVKDGKTVRTRVDGGLWDDIAEKVNDIHTDDADYAEVTGSHCRKEIDRLKKAFKDAEGTGFSPLMTAVMKICRITFPSKDPLLNEGDTIEGEGVPFADLLKPQEITRVAAILEKLGSYDLTMSEAYYKIEGPGNAALKAFRAAFHDPTATDTGLDEYSKESNVDTIQRTLKSSREAYLKIEKCKEEIKKIEVEIEKQEKIIELSEEVFFNLFMDDDPISGILNSYSTVPYKVNSEKAAASVILLRK